MDPLSVLGALIATLQISGTIISYCYDYRKGVRSAPRDLTQILDEVSNLRNVLERLIKLIDEDDASGRGYLPAVKQMTAKNGPLEHCQSDLESIESKLQMPLSKWKSLGKQLAWPLQEKDVMKSLESIKRARSLIESALTIDNSTSIIAIRESTRDLHDRVLDFQRQIVLSFDTQVQVMLDWLGAKDQSSRLKFAIEKRLSTTGSWFLSQDVYENWKSTPGSFWAHGIPKPVVEKPSYEDVIQFRSVVENTAVVYYFFDFGNKLQGTLEAMLRSLLSQILTQAQEIPSRLESLAQGHFRRTRYGPWPGESPISGPRPSNVSQPSISELINAFQGAVEGLDDVYLVIDAPEECVELDMVLDFIETAVSWKSHSLHLLVTSQSRREIEEVVSPVVDSQLLIESFFIREDIASFVRFRLDSDRKLRKWPQEIKNEIYERLIEGSQGMFQWVVFQLQALRECLTPKDIKKTLSALPKTLDATYTRVLENMNESHFKHTMMILKLLALSRHPIQVEEASEFISFDFDAPEGPVFDVELRLPEAEHILDVTSGLVTMNKVVLTYEDGNVKEIIQELHLAHFSVKEFLLSHYSAPSPRTLLGPTAFDDWNAVLSQCCLVYINQMNGLLNRDSPVDFPAARYAAQNWISFAQSSPSEHLSEVENFAFRTLNSSTAVYRNWVCLYDHDMPWTGINFSRKRFPSPLYYASASGLQGCAKSLLQVGENPNAPGGIFGSPLEAAIHHEHTAMAHILICAGAETNASQGYYKSPLMAAVVKGRADMVKLLLENGASPNHKGSYHNNALLEACVRGQIGIVKLLVEAGADPNRYHEKAGGNPVQTATQYNHLEVVALLLPKAKTQTILGGLRAVGTDNATEMMKLYSQFVPDSVLYYAADMGREDIVTDLLNRGASNTSTINNGYMKSSVPVSALVSAATKGHQIIVSQLIESGADVDSGTADCGGLEFALGAAAEKGHFDIVEILLEKGANTDSIARRGGALQRASYRGHRSIICLLLDHGANINQPKGLFGSALQAAVLGSRMEIVSLLLEKGAEINLQKREAEDSISERDECYTPLDAAVEINDTELVQYLLARGARVANAGKRATPLSRAASKNNEDIMRILLNAGADINYGEDFILPPLFCTISQQHIGSMKFLIEAGADVNKPRCLAVYNRDMPTGPGITPLSAAVFEGFEAGVRLLLEHKVNVQAHSSISNQSAESPLHTAAREGYGDIARLLLEHGADANTQIEQGWTPLHLAARDLNEEIVQILVNEFKANVSLTLFNGSQAIHSVANSIYRNDKTTVIIDILIEAGVDVNVCNETGRTPLHWAAERGNHVAVHALRERGARTDVREEETSMTPLDIAKMKLAAETERSWDYKERKKAVEELEKRL